jgi:hypothetical protein
MLEIGTSGNNFALSEWLKSRPKPAMSPRCMGIVFAIFICVLPHAAQAQSAQSSISAYADAIKQSTISDRIAAMEKYLTLSGNSRLKVDALEFLVWDHLRLGHPSQSAQRARELLTISPGNSIAIAVLNQDAPSAQGKVAVQNQLAGLNSAMTAVDRMNKPEGMLDRNFQMLQQQVAIMLNGAIGMAYLSLQDYPRARPALEQAVASDPNNPQWVYEWQRPLSVPWLLVSGARRQPDRRNAAGAGNRPLCAADILQRRRQRCGMGTIPGQRSRVRRAAQPRQRQREAAIECCCRICESSCFIERKLPCNKHFNRNNAKRAE